MSPERGRVPRGAGDRVAAVDCGTTAVKAGVFDLAGRRRGFASAACPCRHVAGGGVELDVAAMEARVFECLRRAVARARASPARITALAVTNQRATVIPARADGRAWGPGLSWQDLRGARAIARLKARIPDETYYRLAGVRNHPVFSLGKILWLREAAEARYRGAAKFALVQGYLLRKLGCREFFCDWSNASLSGMFDVSRLEWSAEILEAADLPRSRLGVLVPPGRRVGSLSAAAARKCGLRAGTPLISGGGDQQCAGVGAGAAVPGVVEITVGTAAVPLACVQRVTLDPKMRTTCGAHAVAGSWNVEALQNSAGASVAWLSRMVTGRAMSRTLLARAARRPPGSNGVFFLPYLTGASAPRWNPEATGALLGLREGRDRADLARAVLEGVSVETAEILEIFGGLGIAVDEVRVTGGGARDAGWNRIQAEIFGCPVVTLREPEATLLGAAVLAAVGAGVFPSAREAAEAMVRPKDRFVPDPARVAAYREVRTRYREICAGMEEAGVFGAAAGGAVWG